MPQIAGQRVAVLICKPFVFCGVGMAGSNIFTLQMLQLAVNVVSVPHSIQIVCILLSKLFKATKNTVPKRTRLF